MKANCTWTIQVKENLVKYILTIFMMKIIIMTVFYILFVERQQLQTSYYSYIYPNQTKSQ